ncbi:hypothetical protein ACGFMM_07660 [Streptomyces sp. NPDC048604]|uniref:hypothetical protein n=1 Tax=Streptomyces sp. NPDC048604 TaxID=3365578 RepID=UPI0037222E61
MAAVLTVLAGTSGCTAESSAQGSGEGSADEVGLWSARLSDSEVPGHSVRLDSLGKDAGASPRQSLTPAQCRPLFDPALGAADRTAEAHVRMTLDPHKKDPIAPVERHITLSQHRPGGADAYLASLKKALENCSTLSWAEQWGARTEASVARKPAPKEGDDSVAYVLTAKVPVAGVQKDSTYYVVIAVRTGTKTALFATAVPTTRTTNTPDKALTVALQHQSAITEQTTKLTRLR